MIWCRSIWGIFSRGRRRSTRISALATLDRFVEAQDAVGVGITDVVRAVGFEGFAHRAGARVIGGEETDTVIDIEGGVFQLIHAGAVGEARPGGALERRRDAVTGHD